MSFGTTTALAPDGSNLTTVIATLFTNSRHGKFAELEAFAKDVFPEIEHLEVPMEGSPPAAEIYLSIGRASGRGVSLRYSGTGIEQALMLATAILTSPSGYLFLVDEPHAFLHPLAERRVLKFIREHAEHQYVVATHSPAFLTAYPLTQAHLITVDAGGSHISDLSAHRALLDELGVSAADLWGSSAIIWLEGDSDVAIAKVAAALVPELSVTFRSMPDAIRAAARGKKYAKTAADMAKELAEAITPVDVAMLFVFDADERGDALRSDIDVATNGLARFLPVREAENMLLSEAVLATDIANQAEILQLPMPPDGEVAKELAQLLNAVDDRKLYPIRVDGPDPERVVGSEVLRRLYWKWTQSEYDKTRDGERLARRTLELAPDRLEPFANLLRGLV
jgi:hypothetical protein